MRSKIASLCVVGTPDRPVRREAVRADGRERDRNLDQALGAVRQQVYRSSCSMVQVDEGKMPVGLVHDRRVLGRHIPE